MYYHPTQLNYSITVNNIYTIHYIEYYRYYIFGGESHDFWELLYIDRGEVKATFKGHLRTLRAGQAVLYKPNEFHAMEVSGTSAPNTVVVSFDSDSEALFTLADKVLEIDTAHKPIIAEILAEGKNAFNTDLGDPSYAKLEINGKRQFGSLQLIKCALEKLFILLLRKEQNAPKEASDGGINRQNAKSATFMRAEEYIDKNMSSKLDALTVANAVELSVSGLNKLCIKHTGKGVIAFLRRKRIRKACEMIRETDLNFSEISFQLGFSSIHYFSRTFKQIQGMSPTEYAKSVQAMIGPDRVK